MPGIIDTEPADKGEAVMAAAAAILIQVWR
jgi:hypothetical protein